jgi:cytochrome c oxidase cbb3-type subunit 1
MKITDNKAALFPLVTSCLYILLGMSVGVLVATKMIWPSIGEFPIFSFGRIRTAHTNIVLFGWLLQANMGLLFYIIPKLLHTKLWSQKLGLATWAIYNIAALGGVICMLTGWSMFDRYAGMKNVEYAEIIPPFDYLVAVAWLLFGLNIVMTIAKRKVKYMYVSVWYVMGSVIWTTFVYVTGNFITQFPGVAGVNQATLSWFYVHNAVGLIFTPLGVAIAYYLIPKELKTPLYSHKLSLIGFWVISFVYVWTGAHHMIHGPNPYWLETVAILFSFSLIIPVAAVVINFVATFKAAPRKIRYSTPIAKFLITGTAFYMLTCLQGPFQAIRTVSTVVSKTDWVVGHAHMAVLGAFSFYAIAGIYYVLPRLINKPLFSQKLASMHFWITFLGCIPFFAALWVSGVIQGLNWLNIEISFLESLRMMKQYHIVRWLSGFAILSGQLVFLYNLWETMFGVPKQVVEDETPASNDVAAEGANQ